MQNTEYSIIEDYSMKCRLYPSKQQKQAIDDAIDAVRIFHNCLVYDMWNNHINVREKKIKDKNGKEQIIHYPDLKNALKADYKQEVMKGHPKIECCPQRALTTNVGLKADLLREFGKTPIEWHKPCYYNERHPRHSYTYQETLSKIKYSPGDTGNEPYVFRINLSKIGEVKVRGWNQKIRFVNSETNFLQFAASYPREVITVTVSKDTAGDYYIIFKLKKCLKPFSSITPDSIGIDVGVENLAIGSDSRVFANPHYKKSEKKHQKRLNRQMSRRWGPSNEEYRAEAKRQRSRSKTESANAGPADAAMKPVVPSKGYIKAQYRHARLNRRIARKRENYNHSVSCYLVKQFGFIGVESLNIKGMVRNRYLSYALNDAGFGYLLSYLQYKAAWHGRIIKAIDKWTPSSKRCSYCGFIYQSTEANGLRPWSLGIRQWTCPECHADHNRDVNAARNILYFAQNEYLKETEI